MNRCFWHHHTVTGMARGTARGTIERAGVRMQEMVREHAQSMTMAFKEQEADVCDGAKTASYNRHAAR